MNGLGAVLAAGDDQQKAAPLGLFVLLLLGLSCYFLFRSMSRHLKRVRDDFPIGMTAPGPATAAPNRPTAPGDGTAVDPEDAVPPPPQ